MLAATRSVVFYTGYIVLTALYGLAAGPLLLTPGRFRHRVMASWCLLTIAWLRITCGVRYRVEGYEHFQGLQQPAVVLAKHQSNWETYALQWLCWPAATVLKRELLNIPFFGWGLRCMEPIAINRDNPRLALKQVREQGEARLRSGLHLLLFPEGTRSAVGTRGRYARSGPDLALTVNAPIVPVAVNAGRCWPPRTFVKYPGLVTVRFGPPIASEGRGSRELIEQVEQWIETEMAALDGASTSLEAQP